MRRMDGVVAAILGFSLCALAGQVQEDVGRRQFHVKYVAADAIYIDGGQSAGLAEGMKLIVKRPQPASAPQGGQEAKKLVEVGVLRVTAVAQVSAVCAVVSSTQEVRAGDQVYLEQSEAAKEVEQKELAGATRKYPQIITFNEGNPLEEEQRAAVPRPPLPSVNRSRGYVGFEYGGLSSVGPFAANTTQLGLVLRADTTRIAGTYWNFRGFWRGRLNTRSSGGQQTLDDLINRTYTLGLTYENPNSHWVAGFGRLYLPWATSLYTIDGGYAGRRFGSITTAGVFAGTTPDPTSWNYAPNRRMAGTFINFTGGSFDAIRYMSTFGVGVSTLGWTVNRPFVFTENSLFYKHYLSIYESLQADRPSVPGQGSKDYTGLSRSFTTLRFQPHPRVSLDLNHNYFRSIPSFDLGLISTGLVDQLLFQGFSGGARVDLVKHITVYNSLGRNTQTGDARSSWNQMYGVTMGQIWRTGVRGDVRWSKFDSSFGRGEYSLLSLSRNFGEKFRCEGLIGRQNLVSSYTRNSSYHSLGGNFDWFPKGRFYMNGGFTRERGNVQNYNQWYIGTGFRFDTFNHQRRTLAEARNTNP